MDLTGGVRALTTDDVAQGLWEGRTLGSCTVTELIERNLRPGAGKEQGGVGMSRLQEQSREGANRAA